MTLVVLDNTVLDWSIALAVTVTATAMMYLGKIFIVRRLANLARHTQIYADDVASLSIVLDKPFVVGDFIIVDNVMGTVEFVGLKTTRLRSLSGEQVIFSNADLLKSRIRNYKRMQSRRVAFNIAVTYQATETQLRAIPQIVRELVSTQPGTSFDRAHFKEYGDSSLNFEVVYNIADPDYHFYMDVQQAINLGLFQRFAQEGIEFGYPTRTVHLVNFGAQ